MSLLEHIPPYLLLGSGVLFGRIESIYSSVYSFFVRRTRVNISATEPESAYEQLDAFVSSLSQKRIRNFHVNASSKLTPGIGYSYFWWKGHLLTVTREVSTTATGAERPPKTLYVSVVFGNRTHIEQIAKEGSDLVQEKKNKNAVYSFGIQYENYWSAIKARQRPLNSVCLSPTMRESINAKIKSFVLAEDRYAELGIPYKLGILMHGPPGTGKTSLVSGISHELKAPLYFLSLGGLADKGLQSAMSQVPPRSVVVLEDIDTVSPGRTPKPLGVSLSCLLNVMDGLLCPHGVVFCLTTNHREKLDSAIIRPGRIDLDLELTYAIPEQIEDMFYRFSPTGDAKLFANKYLGKKVTTSQVQEDLLMEQRIQ